MITGKFKIGDKVVYPSHKSIGTIVAIGEEEIAQTKVELYKIQFQADNMTLHIPVDAAAKSGLRVLNSRNYISQHVIPVLLVKNISKKEETWRACANEYEAKLNSGDLALIAEIIRDLSEEENFTYSKRNIYESALDRLTSEISSIYEISYEQAKQRILMIKNGLAHTIEENVGNNTEKESVTETEEAF